MPPRINENIHVVLIMKDAVRNVECYCWVFDIFVGREGMQSTLRNESGRDVSFICMSHFHVPTRLLLGLPQPRAPEIAAFNWRHFGVPRFGLHVDERTNLDEGIGHLDFLGVEHSHVVTEGPGLLVSFRELDQFVVIVYWPDCSDYAKMITTLTCSRARLARERRQRSRLS